MKILFVCSVYPREREEEIKQNSKGGIDNAANNLQWALIEGLDYYYPNLQVITQPCIRTYPLNYKKIFFKKSSFSHIAGAVDYCLGFINIPLIKHLVKEITLYKILKKNTNYREATTVIIYGIHSPYLKAAVDLKKNNTNIKICQIVPDLPQFMSESINPIYRFLKKIDSIFINKFLYKIDSFVLLSQYMAEQLKVGIRPWTTVEGIFRQPDFSEYVPKLKNKTILYTGTLARRYGIINLLEAFEAIKDSNYRLWICGEGDCRMEIENRAKSDTRIKYYGQQSRTSVLSLQKQATVLVNPRTSSGEYTIYSFPSKIIEYMASGTPCIMYNLKGIPEEYFNYCFVVRKENVESLKEMIMTVCEKDQAELDELGEKASKFILENKNPIAQVKKIYEMIAELLSHT